MMSEIIHEFANHPENPYHCPGEEFDATAWRFGATASQTAGETGAAELELIAQGAESSLATFNPKLILGLNPSKNGGFLEPRTPKSGRSLRGQSCRSIPAQE